MDTTGSEDLHENIRLNSFGEKTHTLVLNAKELIFDGAHFSLSAITHLKFGVKIMQFGMFPVGRKYQVSLKTPAEQLDLVFRTYLGISDKYFTRLFERVVDGIWLHIGERLFRHAIDLLLEGKTFITGTCSVSRQGIILHQDTPLTKKQYLIPWHEVSYEKKYNRLVINSKSNRLIWANLYFLDDWNVDVLMNVLDWLFEEDGLAQLEQNT